ncbi:hypothetical protein [Absidia glauca]|uniref:Auxin efflux carrier n=1 Tax=Absidia glauca TaxID=4829 RepID=A0A163JLK5_ABSGL|nr:hypothetical protein [Absidia glauca]
MLELILSALQAILQVIAVVLFGALLTKTGHIDQSKQKWLSQLNLNFFTPCLLFFNIASVISLDKLVAFWPIPAFFVVFTFISWLASQIVIQVLGIRGIHQRFVVACTLFCNTNSLPIAIISSLAFSEASRVLYWHSNDTQQDIAMRGIAYTMFYAMFCNIIRWSYGYHLLQPPLYEATHKEQRHLSYSSTTSTLQDESMHQVTQKDDCLSPPTSLPANETTSLLPTHYIHPLSPGPLINHRYYQPLKRVLLRWHGAMSPPLYAALLALMVGLSPVKPFLFDKHAFLYPSLTLAIQSCGKVAVPLILICLGSQLTFIAQQGGSSDSSSPRRVVLASVVARMILSPLLVVLTVLICLKYTNVALMHDPMFVVTLILLGCTPTAINLSQITQVSGYFEQEMMHVLFWSYGVICVPIMTTIVFLALSLVDTWLV